MTASLVALFGDQFAKVVTPKADKFNTGKNSAAERKRDSLVTTTSLSPMIIYNFIYTVVSTVVVKHFWALYNEAS